MKRLLKKIKRFIKRHIKTRFKRHCKKCKFYIKYIERLDGYKYNSEREEDDGKDICRKTIEWYTTEVGEKLIHMYKDMQRCEHCGCIIHDKSKLVYKKCRDMNYKYKCKLFKPKCYYYFISILELWE